MVNHRSLILKSEFVITDTLFIMNCLLKILKRKVLHCRNPCHEKKKFNSSVPIFCFPEIKRLHQVSCLSKYLSQSYKKGEAIIGNTLNWFISCII